MAEKYRYSTGDRYRNAVVGSSATVPEEVPVPERRKNPGKKARPHLTRKQQIEREREIRLRRDPTVLSAPAMGFAGFVCLVIGAVFMLYSCISYLHANGELTEIQNSTAAAEEQYMTLKSDNDELEKTVYSEIDLEQIRKTAIEKLGMVYPYETQVIKYRYNRNGYVRQYSDFTVYKEGLPDTVLKNIVGK